jgi:hypothetical protein
MDADGSEYARVGGGEELAVGGRGRMFVSGWAEESSHDQRSAHFPVIRRNSADSDRFEF